MWPAREEKTSLKMFIRKNALFQWTDKPQSQFGVSFKKKNAKRIADMANQKCPKVTLNPISI